MLYCVRSVLALAFRKNLLWRLLIVRAATDQRCSTHSAQTSTRTETYHLRYVLRRRRTAHAWFHLEVRVKIWGNFPSSVHNVQSRTDIYLWYLWTGILIVTGSGLIKRSSESSYDIWAQKKTTTQASHYLGFWQFSHKSFLSVDRKIKLLKEAVSSVLPSTIKAAYVGTEAEWLHDRHCSIC